MFLSMPNLLLDSLDPLLSSWWWKRQRIIFRRVYDSLIVQPSVDTHTVRAERGVRVLTLLCNSVYTTWFNRCYGRGGHLFQGRDKGIIVDKSSYLLEFTG